MAQSSNIVHESHYWTNTQTTAIANPFQPNNHSIPPFYIMILTTTVLYLTIPTSSTIKERRLKMKEVMMKKVKMRKARTTVTKMVMKRMPKTMLTAARKMKRVMTMTIHFHHCVTTQTMIQIQIPMMTA